MFRAQYVVLEHDGLWKIRFEGRHFGPYPNERAAIHAAIEAAERSPKSNYEPRVMTQSSRTGELNVEWTRGEPVPPDMQRRASVPAQTLPAQDAQDRRRAS